MKQYLPKDMRPEEIRAAMHLKKTSQVEIARALGRSKTLVNRVITGLTRSDTVQREIAKAIGMEVERIWPSVYLNGQARKPGRPMGYGVKQSSL